MVLSKDDILGLNDIDVKKVDINIDNWTSVYIKKFSGAEREKFARIWEAKENVISWVVCLTLCDEKGDRLFEDTDVELLAKKSGRAIEAVFLAALEFNGLQDDAVEVAEGNSETGQKK